MKQAIAIPKRMPKPQLADAATREYMRNLLKYQRAYQAFMLEGLKGLVPELKAVAKEEMPVEIKDSATVVRMDANIEKEVRLLFELVQNKLMKMFPDTLLRKWAKAMAGHVNDIGKKNIQKTAATVDLEVESLLKDGELNPYFNNIIDENVGLIRSIPEEHLPQFKNSLVYAITRDLPQTELSKIIQKNFAMTKNKAGFIARDQTNKLNAKVAEYRQKALGGERYIWRTVEDVRVRPDHAKLDGKTFYWDKPPVIDKRTGRRGNPGSDFQCRCYAEMVIADVLK